MVLTKDAWQSSESGYETHSHSIEYPFSLGRSRILGRMDNISNSMDDSQAPNEEECVVPTQAYSPVSVIPNEERIDNLNLELTIDVPVGTFMGGETQYVTFNAFDQALLRRLVDIVEKLEVQGALNEARMSTLLTGLNEERMSSLAAATEYSKATIQDIKRLLTGPDVMPQRPRTFHTSPKGVQGVLGTGAYTHMIPQSEKGKGVVEGTGASSLDLFVPNSPGAGDDVFIDESRSTPRPKHSAPAGSTLPIGSILNWAFGLPKYSTGRTGAMETPFPHSNDMVQGHKPCISHVDKVTQLCEVYSSSPTCPRPAKIPKIEPQELGGCPSQPTVPGEWHNLNSPSTVVTAPVRPRAFRPVPQEWRREHIVRRLDSPFFLIPLVFIPICEPPHSWYMMVVDVKEPKVYCLDTCKTPYSTPMRELNMRAIMVVLSQIFSMEGNLNSFNHCSLDPTTWGSIEYPSNVPNMPDQDQWYMICINEIAVWCLSWLQQCVGNFSVSKLSSKLHQGNVRMKTATSIFLNETNQNKKLVDLKSEQVWETIVKSTS
ncbi:hypothetical protein PIB30_085322 [Stylosanthes scabra]|uniref:Ubiquitin-like protease family profile domain-containing protein n=1 Tax=Stylosanthes scabra TaxID=79078 RepID=A0ABU6WR47_9FABA|nr:hypothetical protein [Stylosanthes scabra]